MANFNVTNTNDSGAGSLRDAIAQANNTNGADTISFTDPIFQDSIADTIILTSGELEITDTLIINGTGSINVTVSGNNSSRVFNVNNQDSNNQITVEITGLTITGETSVDNGGGILNLENQAISSSISSSNSTTEGSSGAIASSSILTINNTGAATATATAISTDGNIFVSVTDKIASTASASASSSNGVYTVSGNNTLKNGASNDRLIVDYSTGDNLLSGGDGNDTLTASGASGKKTLIGNDGNDYLTGGKGNDSLYGGNGIDTFAFNSFNEGIDTIYDFNATNELIQVSAAGFGGGLSTPSLNASQFTIGTSATTDTQRFIYNSTTGGLFFDQDGSASGFTQVQFAQLSGGLPISENNFVII
ncbi:calcium-binding protein [Nostoc flagelliforme FACHB-838]|uniref:Calcium-binding protein n=1 Tax=Nostoc flagelliforme FACHB-838 TaxID=2692904 RepID=A0ABR8DHR3_9NOSO|nr:calcium-binding protein [Nostoc flagelliforme]MBD2528921.1 calcium-binding protein [Nostoc flagelliforme FACHB-838]